MVKVTMTNPGRGGRAAQTAKLAKANKFMRKTTKKGAYAKGKKKAFANRRRPFVEKKAVDGAYRSTLLTTTPSNTGLYPNTLLPTPIPATDAFHMIALQPWYRMTQGFKEYEMIGDNVFSQSLQLKTEIEFPIGQDVIVNPFRVYLVCGWITNPIGKTPYTTLTQDNVTQVEFQAYVVSQIKEHFDDSTDRLQFNSDARRNIVIDKYSRCLPSTAENTFGPQTENVAAYSTSYGAPPRVERRHTWKINRKIHYTKGKEMTDNNTKPYAGDELLQNWYPNESWIPFACLYMPDYDSMNNQQGTRQNLSLRYNVLHVYSDS